MRTMTHNAPGKHFRKGLSLKELFKMFPDDDTAEAWFVKARWPNVVACPHCGSVRVQLGAKHKTMPYRCREKECRKRFSPRTGTALEASNIGFKTWMIAIYLLATNLKGISSMKLHRDLDISQKSAWFLAHRLRQSWASNEEVFDGPVEVDETFVGGKERNKHSRQKRRAGRGPVGKTAVVGVRDRTTKRVRAAVVENTDANTLKWFVAASTTPDAMVYTDGDPGYVGLLHHEAVRHSIGEYVRGQAHTNGIESFWSMLKRGYYGTYHKMSPAHLNRYVNEFSGRHNQRPSDTVDQMAAMVRGMDGKRLRYEDLIATESGIL